MKILAIRGKNLASFADSFEIDFQADPLASAGLFAISGPTGAGKSTLLDALCLALYGNTPRLDQASSTQIPDIATEQVTSTDPRNLLRRGKGEGYAEVDFIGIDKVAYRARWSVRRARSRSDGRLQGVEYLLTRIADSQAACGHLKSEVHSTIERLVGLSFPQFTRAVLLAQNDFAAFLKADDNERAELLQTLTGTERFAHISMRVYERAMAEKRKLEDIIRQFEGSPPLPDEQRSELEQQLAALRATQQLLQRDKQRIDEALLWHKTLSDLEAAAQSAKQSVELALQAHQSAQAQREHLALIDAVEPSRPLVAERRRLESEIALGTQTSQSLASKLEEAVLHRDSADTARTMAQQQHEAIEEARRQRTPEIEAAKRLDTEITALQPQVDRALEQLTKTKTELTDLKQRTEDATRQHTATSTALTETSTWLEQNKALETLANQWEHWDYLFKQADKAHSESLSAQARLATQEAQRSQACTTQTEQDTIHARNMDHEKTALTAFEQAETQLSAFNLDQIAQDRQVSEGIRSGLINVQTHWRDLLDRCNERDQHTKDVERLKHALNATLAELHSCLAEKPAREGRLQQAERSLQLTNAACGQHVDSLRAGLIENEPCPVCGATAHPYASDSSTHHLHELQRQQQADRDTVRKSFDELVSKTAGLQATHATQSAQLKDLEERCDQAIQRRDQAEQAWHTVRANTLAAPDISIETALADIPDADVMARLEALQASAEQSLKAHDATQQTALAARKTLDQRRKQLDAQQALVQQSRRAQEAAGLAARNAMQACQVTQTQIDQANAAKQQALANLDAALSAPNWQTLWEQSPTTYHQARQHEADRWRKQHTAHSQQTSLLADLDKQCQHLGDLSEKAHEHATRQEQEWATYNAQLRSKRDARQHLLEGKTVAEVESRLERELTQTASSLAKQTETANEVRNLVTQLTATHQSVCTSLDVLREKATSASHDFEVWLAKFNAQAGQQLDAPTLLALLDNDTNTLAAERSTLAHIDRALATAQTVLGERQTQIERHRQQATDKANESSSEQLRVALETLVPQIEAIGKDLQEAEFRQRQDDQCRTLAATLIQVINAQTATNEVWAKLNDVIGSSKGDKFRKIAQQYTLDILLAYANHHLTDISRRYRLERVPDTLTLMVLDHDMGGEHRSVHSLSGGESFLVSLALALGLASLSSHSVKVESLFIDEGFGSLDADTLAIAMNALDNLQAQGRKVGVISHVHEMSERIGVQIQVQPQSNGLSKLLVR